MPNNPEIIYIAQEDEDLPPTEDEMDDLEYILAQAKNPLRNGYSFTKNTGCKIQAAPPCE